MSGRFDHIVVGGGSAGSVMAARLAQGGRSVLLLEAGDNNGRSLLHRLPFSFPKLWFRKDTSWGLVSEPEPGLNGRRLPVPRGRGLGGSSAINGMIYNRGSRWDWDHWAQLVSPDWSFEGMLRHFKKVEGHYGGETNLHGGRGPVQINRLPSPSPLSRSLLAAGKAQGFPITDDFAGEEPEGWGVPDFTIDRRGRRCSASDAYLAPARGLPSLTIERGALAARILFEDHRATGVRYLQAGTTKTAHARAEIILCGGTLASPQLLMLSGIGPREVLERSGVTMMLERAEVGRNLQDHIGSAFEVEATSEHAFENTLRFDRLAAAAVQWSIGLNGPLAAPPVVGMGILRSTQDIPAPDLRMIVSGVSMGSRPWFPIIKPGRGPAMMIGFSICYPQSRGFLEIKSASPTEAPAFRYNGLCDEADIQALTRGYRLIRELCDAPQMRPIIRALPGHLPDPHDAGAVETWLRQTAMITHHPVGTCRMGADPAAVVDRRCRVNGVGQLRVVDASIFPAQIGGNPNVPIMAIAEKIAEDIVTAA